MVIPIDARDTRVGGRVLVIGAGVSGLTSALCLRRRGFEVTVVADRFAPLVTSVVAGALWEWPPAVCGYHQDQVSLALQGLGRDQLRGLRGPRPRPGDGRLPPAGDLLPQGPDRRRPATAGQDGGARAYGPAVPARSRPDRGERRQPRAWPAGRLHPPGADGRHGSLHAWLLDRAREAGCTIEQRRVVGSLRGQEEALAHSTGPRPSSTARGWGPASSPRTRCRRSAGP